MAEDPPSEHGSRELANTAALALGAALAAGDVTSVELVQLYLDRIDALDADIGAYVTVARSQALDAAADADDRTRRGSRRGPLDGVPISIKDFVDTAGIRTTAGTRSWWDRVPEQDAAVVSKLRGAGLVVLGKSTIPELTGGNYVENEMTGVCRNPWNPEFTCGGSSYGAAAGLAAGLCALAHGTDDGGSVRIPAAWTGLVGLKPARGRISAAPEPQAMEYTSGPIARTVGDAAAMLDVMAGYVTGDAFWAPPPERPFLDEVGRDPGRLRIAYIVTGAPGVALDAEYADAVLSTATVLAGLGHHVFEVQDWPGRGTFPDDRIMPLHEMYGAQWAGRVAQGLLPPVDQLEPANRHLVEVGGRAKAADLLMASRLAQMTARQVVHFFDDVDVLLTPVTSGPPPRIGSLRTPEAVAAYLSTVQFTAQFNVTGQPAITVPASRDRHGIPIGVQLAGRPADEATLLRVAAQLEQAQPWVGARPPLGSDPSTRRQ